MVSKEQIEEIIHAYLDGSAQEPDLRLLLQWIRENDLNLHHFNKLCNIWYNSTNRNQSEMETELALNSLNRRIQEYEHKKTLEDPFDDQNSFLWLKIAATAILILGVSAFFYFALRSEKVKNPVYYVTAIAPKSQKSQLILSDGTKVWLNSGTTLKYRTDYGEHDRKIFLEGEAFFEVAKNPSKPFLVHAANIVVRAIGTSFNVKCYAEDKLIETTLVEGKVKVFRNSGIPNQEFVVLMPNERAIFNRSDNKLVVSKFEAIPETEKQKIQNPEYVPPKSLESIISWKDEQLIFENEPFGELTKRLERWYNVKINVTNPEINLNCYTGKFVNNETLEKVMKIISRTTPIKYTIENNKVLIETKY